MMSKVFRFTRVGKILTILGVFVPAYAQQTYVTPGSVPSELRRQLQALGDRLTKPGQERVTLAATLTDSTGSTPVQVVSQLGGQVRVDSTGGPQMSVAFSGA